jgi:hypothetical protein
MVSGLSDFALRLALVGALTMLAAAEACAQWSGWGTPQPQAQATPAAPPASRGENFSAGKPPAQLFASDCTGSGCHKSAQGLSKDRGRISLAGFLREHYTNSRESAAALAAYLVSLPAETRAARPERQPRAAARSDDAKPGDDASRTRKPAATERDESKPAEAKPATRTQRGRQATAAPPTPPAPVPTPEPEAAPAAPPPAPEPPPKPKWDIFD